MFSLANFILKYIPSLSNNPSVTSRHIFSFCLHKDSSRIFHPNHRCHLGADNLFVADIYSMREYYKKVSSIPSLHQQHQPQHT